MSQRTTMHTEALLLKLKSPFRLAHGTSQTRRNVLVRLGDGIGEGALPPYYPHSFDDVTAYLDALDAGALLAGDPLHLEDALDQLPPGPAPARAAVDMALHDHWGQQLDRPLYVLWGLNPGRAPLSSLTLSLPEHLDAFRQHLRDAREYPVLKLKLGASRLDTDEELVRIAREETDARIGVDANGGWSVDEAVQMIARLVDYDLLFVEQPIPAGDPNAWHRLRERLPDDAPPLIADESAQTARDVLDLAGAADGINIKLAKAGGLRGARRLIALARALEMQVLLGCMIESSAAVTAAAHLAPLVDFADLDGHLHVANDLFDGMTVEHGLIRLPDAPGLGITERTPSSSKSNL